MDCVNGHMGQRLWASPPGPPEAARSFFQPSRPRLSLLPPGLAWPHASPWRTQHCGYSVSLSLKGPATISTSTLLQDGHLLHQG